MEIFNPSHPGEVIKAWLIEDEDGNKINTVKEVAETLGIHRTTLHRILSGAMAVSTEVAVALESIECGDAKLWLTMQMNYDLFQYKSQEVA
ncbi:HigA family addiction module antitoxin [Pseudoteredinibacter isoporae]|uniref:HigA family addiction module antitoxin n=1 Tax=Pseudoteredinibacter isoporae TaxID=570281 RepID=UPI0031058400